MTFCVLEQHQMSSSTLVFTSSHACAVLQCGDSFSAISVHEHYEAQRTLAYGADWCYAIQQDLLAATCSFYDKQVHLWQPTFSCM